MYADRNANKLGLNWQHLNLNVKQMVWSIIVTDRIYTFHWLDRYIYKTVVLSPWVHSYIHHGHQFFGIANITTLVHSASNPFYSNRPINPSTAHISPAILSTFDRRSSRVLQVTNHGFAPASVFEIHF